MTADELMQLLSGALDEPLLDAVRHEADFPCLTNTLHLAVLLIDCDTELSVNGLLGFLENSTGRFLGQTTEALRLIGCPQSFGRQPGLVLESSRASGSGGERKASPTPSALTRTPRR